MSVVSVTDCGAIGDGTRDDTVAFAAAIGKCKASGSALYIPAAPVRYLTTKPLDLTNTNGFKIYGDGAAPTVNRWTPQKCSCIAGATGGAIIDATGANGLVIRDLTMGSINQSTPATVGIVMGTSTTAMGHGGSCNLLDNVSIFLASSGNACGVYGVNANLLTMNKVNVMSDYCLILTDANDLGITPLTPFGPSIQSDGCDTSGCNFEGYGTQVPVVFKNAACHTHAQMYIVNLNDGPGYTGVAHAMSLTDCDDIDMKVEIDYFPAAVCMAGFNQDIDLRGTIYRDTTPILPSQPAVATFIGTGLERCKFSIRNGVASPGNALYETNGGTGRTNKRFRNCEFLFDTTMNPVTCAFDLASGYLVPYDHCMFVGDEDFAYAGINLAVRGSAAALSAMRVFVQGLRVGDA